MKKDNDSPVSSTALTSTAIDLTKTTGLYVKTNRTELASRLFAMGVDLESVLERKKERFRAQMKEFVEETQENKRDISFNPREVSTPVHKEERVPGFYSFLIGLFGYERRVRRTHFVVSKRLNTKDVVDQIEKFIEEAQESFEKKVMSLLDVEATVQEFRAIAGNQLNYDDFAILKVAIRRALSKMSVKPWQVRFDLSGPNSVLVEPAEIAAASESAQLIFDRVCNSIIAKANAARRKFEEDIAKVLDSLNEELINACLDRKRLEQILQETILQKNGLNLDSLLRGSDPGDAGLRGLSAMEAEDWRRAILSKPV